MKMFISALLFFIFSLSSYAAAIIPGKDPLAGKVIVPLFGSNKMISLATFINLNPKKYKELTGQRLNFMGKIKLKISRQYARKMIRKDGTVNMDKMKKGSGFFDKWQWHWGGFALGFLILLGPIIALFFNDDYKWDRFWTATTVTSTLLLCLSIVVAALV